MPERSNMAGFEQDAEGKVAPAEVAPNQVPADQAAPSPDSANRVAANEAPVTAKKAAKFVSAISGKERPRRDLVPLDAVRPSLAERIRRDHPDLAPDALISVAELARFRTLYVEELLVAEHGELTELDRQVAESIPTPETLP